MTSTTVVPLWKRMIKFVALWIKNRFANFKKLPKPHESLRASNLQTGSADELAQSLNTKAAPGTLSQKIPSTGNGDSIRPGNENWKKSFYWPLGMVAGLLLMAALAWEPDQCKLRDESPVQLTQSVVPPTSANHLASGAAPNTLSAPEEQCVVRHYIPRELADTLLPLLALTWIAGLFGWFLYCFTGEPYDNRTRAITFAYFFMVLSFGVVAVMVTDIGKATKFGVIVGCVENLDQKTHIPIQCDFPITAERELLTAKKVETGENKPAVNTDVSPKRKTPTKLTTPPVRSTTTIPADLDGSKIPPITDEAYLTSDALLTLYRKNANYHYLLNIGGHPVRLKNAQATNHPFEISPPIYAIRGGLPVPIFFVLLALMGGAISLAKNVPGIQKRSDYNWTSTATEPRLLPGETRELLIFQVLQFVSAPLIAIAAYHTIKPESLASTVALGFLAGFSSDNILASVRTALKGGQTSGAAQGAQTLTGSVHGMVLHPELGGSLPVVGVTVTLEGTSIPPTKTDTNGGYKFPAIPVSSTPYVVRASLDKGDKTVNVTVATPTSIEADVIRSDT